VSITLDQVDALQTWMPKDPDNRRLNSPTIGQYQVIRTTLRVIRKQLPGRYPAVRACSTPIVRTRLPAICSASVASTSGKLTGCHSTH
jgi:hypothetical protein